MIHKKLYIFSNNKSRKGLTVKSLLRLLQNKDANNWFQICQSSSIIITSRLRACRHLHKPWHSDSIVHYANSNHLMKRVNQVNSIHFLFARYNTTFHFKIDEFNRIFLFVCYILLHQVITEEKATLTKPKILCLITAVSFASKAGGHHINLFGH